MIRAAAKHAYGKGPPPPELELALNAREWGSLPEAGGIRDQPAGLLRNMRLALNTYETAKSYRARKAGEEDKWVESHGQAAFRLARMAEGLTDG